MKLSRQPHILTQDATADLRWVACFLHCYHLSDSVQAAARRLVFVVAGGAGPQRFREPLANPRVGGAGELEDARGCLHSARVRRAGHGRCADAFVSAATRRAIAGRRAPHAERDCERNYVPAIEPTNTSGRNSYYPCTL